LIIYCVYQYVASQAVSIEQEPTIEELENREEDERIDVDIFGDVERTVVLFGV